MTRFKKALDEISAGTAMNAARLRNKRAEHATKAAALAAEALIDAKKGGMKKLNPKGYKAVEKSAEYVFSDAIRQRIQANKNNDFLKAAIEYIAGEILIDSVSEYVLAVQNITKDLQIKYGVFNADDALSSQDVSFANRYNGARS